MSDHRDEEQPELIWSSVRWLHQRTGCCLGASSHSPVSLPSNGWIATHNGRVDSQRLWCRQSGHRDDSRRRAGRRLQLDGEAMSAPLRPQTNAEKEEHNQNRSNRNQNRHHTNERNEREKQKSRKIRDFDSPLPTTTKISLKQQE